MKNLSIIDLSIYPPIHASLFQESLLEGLYCGQDAKLHPQGTADANGEKKQGKFRGDVKAPDAHTNYV